MSRSYNVKQSFFRRVIWTAANKRLFYITSAVAAVLVLFTLISLDWAINIKPEVYRETISQNYISFLEKSSEAGHFSTAEPGISTAAKEYNLIKPTREISLTDLLDKMKKQKVFQPPSAVDRATQFREEFIRPKTSEIIPITAAIERVPHLTELPAFESRSEKPLSLQRDSDFIRKFSKPLNIPRPEVVNFASTNGNRDLEETTAVININESEIQNCVEQFTKFNPKIAGDFEVKFTIHPKGYVIPSSIKIVNANITDFRVLKCIKKRIRRWRNFPKIALEDGNFTITRKYIF